MLYGVACCLLMVMTCCLVSVAKEKKTTIYIFGYAASYVDSLAYVTDIQKLDSAYIETKGGFLIGRGAYSGQLEQYVQQYTGKENINTAVFFSEKKKKLEKTLQRVTSLCQKDTVLRFNRIPADAQFRFHAVQPDAPQVVEAESAAPKR